MLRVLPHVAGAAEDKAMLWTIRQRLAEQLPQRPAQRRLIRLHVGLWRIQVVSQRHPNHEFGRDEDRRDTFQHLLIRLAPRVFHKRQFALGHSDTALPRGHVDMEQELSHLLRLVASPADFGS